MRNYFLGKIKWYDNLKDYGFLYDIEEENCKSIYFNWKSIVHPYTTSDVLNCLVVRFEKKVKTELGLRAVNISPASKEDVEVYLQIQQKKVRAIMEQKRKKQEEEESDKKKKESEEIYNLFSPVVKRHVDKHGALCPHSSFNSALGTYFCDNHALNKSCRCEQAECYKYVDCMYYRQELVIKHIISKKYPFDKLIEMLSALIPDNYEKRFHDLYYKYLPLPEQYKKYFLLPSHELCNKCPMSRVELLDDKDAYTERKVEIHRCNINNTDINIIKSNPVNCSRYYCYIDKMNKSEMDIKYETYGKVSSIQECVKRFINEYKLSYIRILGDCFPNLYNSYYFMGKDKDLNVLSKSFPGLL